MSNAIEFLLFHVKKCQRALIKCWQLTAGQVPGPRSLSLSCSPPQPPPFLSRSIGRCSRSLSEPRVLSCPDGGGSSRLRCKCEPWLESDPRALMGLANKNDRHATHLSPRELLFNGLHPASVPPGRLAEPVVTQLCADIDIRLLTS